MKQHRSKYMKFLPSLFHEPLEDEDVPFIERYITIFEKILSGIEDDHIGGKKGIEEMIDIIPHLFHPQSSFLFDEIDSTPSSEPESTNFSSYFGADRHKETLMDGSLEEFLGWLASWMALDLKENRDIQKKKEVIAKIIPLYRMRGTKRGLEEYLKIYVGDDINIIDEMELFQVGVSSHVGVNTIIGGFPPYFFIVNIQLPESDLKSIEDKRKTIEEIIDSEKPVHTEYWLNIKTSQVNPR
jgi:phage tail-like protein